MSLHVNAAVLLMKVQVEKLFFIQLEAARVHAGNEDGVTRTLHEKSGAWVDIQSQMNSKEPGMLVRGKGTEAELYVLDGLVKLLNESAQPYKRKVRIQ